MKNIAPLFPRFILGFGFVYHGFPKLFLPGEREAFVGMLQMIGVPQPGLMAWAVGGTRVCGWFGPHSGCLCGDLREPADPQHAGGSVHRPSPSRI